MPELAKLREALWTLTSISLKMHENTYYWGWGWWWESRKEKEKPQLPTKCRVTPHRDLDLDLTRRNSNVNGDLEVPTDKRNIRIWSRLTQNSENSGDWTLKNKKAGPGR